MEFIFIETKTFGGDIAVNDHGEFSVQYPGERIYDIPSPLEQSRRHANVLARLLDRLEIRPRVGGRHRMDHVILVDPKRAVHRPDPKRFDASCLLKADQFPEWHKKKADRNPGILEALSSLADVRGTETIKEWAEQIARQHRPSNPLDLPEFMRPRPEPARATQGMRDCGSSRRAAPVAEDTTAPESLAPQRKLICATCGAKISFAEGRFCWNQPQRFGGGQYCREHQAAYR
jgi:hypothetical protein